MEEQQDLRWFNVASVPTNYSFPMENRPGQLPFPICQTIPVIDLQKAATSSSDKLTTIKQMIEASQEYGLFQVINHGVSKNAVKELFSLCRDFFNLPIEDKKCDMESFQGGRTGGWIYKNSTDFAQDGIHLWRDSIKHDCYPIKDCMQRWPTKPTRYREVVATYLDEIRVLSRRILEMINEGLGLKKGYLEELSQVQHFVANYYPPCPDPALTLGLLKHCDPSLITILVQDGDACGLQVVNNNGEWMGVAPLPDALIVNIGNQLAIISNGKLKSPEHRAVNSKETRTSIATFVNPSPNSRVEPAKALVDEFNPPRYAPTLYKDFICSSKAYGPPS